MQLCSILVSAAVYVAPNGSTYFLKIDRDSVKKLLAHASDTEAIIVGNSHGEDVLVSELDVQGYQLSRAWGDFFEIAYYLESLVPRFPNPDVVIIPVPYFSFGWDNPSAPNLNVRRVDMYAAIPSFRVLPGDFQYYLIGKGNGVFPIKSILREDNWTDIFYSVLDGNIQTYEPGEPIDLCEPLEKVTLDEHSRTRASDQINRGLDISKSRPSVRVDAYRTVENIIMYFQKKVSGSFL